MGYRRQREVFFGWWVVGGLFFATFFGSWGRYIIAALLGFIHQDLGWSAAEINLSVSIALWVYAGSVIVVGRLVDRWGGQRVIVTGSILLSTGFILLSLVGKLWQLYLVHGVLLAVACAMTHAVPTQAVARKWFIKRAGFVGGILVSAFALSQSLLAPLLTQGASILSWRVVCLAATLFGIVVLALALLLVRDTPESIGLQPYGANGGKGEKPLPPAVRTQVSVRTEDFSDYTVSQALRTVSFWALFFAYGFLAVSLQGVLSNIVHWGNSVGISMGSAGLAATALHFSAIPGKLFWGFLGDKIGKRSVLIAGNAICLLIMLGGWLLVHNSFTLYIFAIVYGLFYGAGISLIAPYLGDLFGRKNLASLFGLVTAAHGFIGGFGPLLWGVIFDRTGTYNLAALSAGIIYIFVVICFIFARPPYRRGTSEASASLYSG
jgi:MFS family permease